VDGEIHIGGTGVALNYWNDIEKTASSYFMHSELGRLYRTGDRGKWNENGYIEFVGRKDNQIKIRGYRVELNEIEKKLLSLQGVKQAIVNIMGSTDATKTLVAYIVPSFDVTDQSSIKNNELVQFKLAQHGDRVFNNIQKEYALFRTENNDLEIYAYKRKSYRNFIDRTLTFSDISTALKINKNEDNFSEDINLNFDILGEILSAFYGYQHSNELPKYCYPSAGNLYPVQLYIRINPGVIPDMEGGYYYYDRRSHKLILISPSEHHEESIQIYCIAKLSAIVPIYGDKSEDFYFIETGYIHALLNEVSRKHVMQWTMSLNEYSNINQHIKFDENDSRLLCSLSLASAKPIEKNQEQVDLYIYVKTGASKELAGGWYYHDNGELIAQSWPPLPAIEHVRNDTLLWRQSLFAVYIVSKHQHFSRESLIDSGYLSQILMSNLLNKSFGSCAIGEINSYHQPALNLLFNNRKIVHHFVVGAVDQSQMEDKNLSVLNKIDSFKRIIKRELSQQLPEYMLPTDMVIFEKFPLTANGKIDLKNLLLFSDSKNQIISHYVKPRNSLESEMCEIWSKILNVSAIGIKDNFFRMGGNSLLAMQVVSQINNKLNTKLQLKDIYEFGDIEHISDECVISESQYCERVGGQL